MIDAEMRLKAVHIFCGEYGNYEIPQTVYAAVKKWKRNGWPDRRFKAGSDLFRAWLRDHEEVERKKLFGEST